MNCPTCDGKGVLGGCGRDDCDYMHTLMFCNDCEGIGVEEREHPQENEWKKTA